VTASVAITDTSFHHVAITKSGTTAIFYIDGVSIQHPHTGTTYSFSTPVGNRPRGGTRWQTVFTGRIDEVSVMGGRCPRPEIRPFTLPASLKNVRPIFPPYIITQPANQTVTVGSDVSIGVTAGGQHALKLSMAI